MSLLTHRNINQPLTGGVPPRYANYCQIMEEGRPQLTLRI